MVVRLIKRASVILKRKLRMMIKKLVKDKSKNVYTFCILCVKKPVYVGLMLENINSLHYLNSRHKFVVYMDRPCWLEFKKSRRRLDYPRQVRAKIIKSKIERPWQYSKMETLIAASKNGHILTDADGVWHHDPQINQDKITLLVKAYDIKDNREESELAKRLIKERVGRGLGDPGDLKHFVTGFVSIPEKFMTEKLEQDLRFFLASILENELSFVKKEKRKKEIWRIAEELAVNLAVQNNYPASKIAALKREDGPGSNLLLQSLYYGCKHEIND